MSPARRALAALGGVAALVWSGVSIGTPAWATAGAAASKPGAYCPLPEPGQRSACLGPARSQYEPFFNALEEGEVEPQEAARIEADLAVGEAGETAYLALSSLAYAYWLLALRAAESSAAEPEIVARLERWNEVLSAAYAQSAPDSAFRDALREAARDLHRRAPSQGLPCVSETGETIECQPAASLLEAIQRVDSQLGLRGAIRRVLQRVFGSGAT